tara:strand:- start:759 stop:2825 length:2067 start_codon:yes stop_codon:yes gene_type:complete
MTYKELNARLSKCESALEKIKNGTYKTLSKTDLEETTKKLTLLRESLQKQLSDAVEFEKGKEQDAADFAKDNPETPVKIVGEDIKFSIDETKAIAKKVGEAVALALKEAGDEIGTMKAKRIEPNSFEIYVEYKKDIGTDEFSFYITDDTLHLTDFSFDKELVDVGVKPSGEALVNVDVLKNELTKHFASMSENIKEAPEGMYYIKIPRDAASQNKAQVIFNDIYGIDYEINDDPDGIVMYFKKEDFDPGLEDDLMGDQVRIIDTNMPLSEEKEMIKKEDMDVGHQDDEPDMLQSTAFETAQYAAKLVKKLQKYDNFDGEVDFPNWWQSKLILAKDYMQKAYHYLDSEEKQPAIDQLALENVDKVAGGIPYKREGNKFIITEPLDDATKERIIGRAKEHGHHAAPNQAGGVTIMAKEGDGMTTKIKPSEGDPTNMAYTDKVNEELSDDQRDALEELERILDQASELGGEARDIIAQSFPNHLSQGDAYGAFNFGDSSNSYDTTLSSIVQSIYDGDEDMDEGRSLTDINSDIEKIKKLASHMNSLPQDDPKRKAFVAKVKKLNQEKKDHEKDLHKKVKKTGVDQELTEGRGDMDAIKRIISDRASDSGFEEREEAAEVIAAIAEEYMLSLKVIQAYMDSDGPVNPHDVHEAELDKKEKKKLKDMSKSLKKSSKGHAGQAKYLDKLTKENA